MRTKIKEVLQAKDPKKLIGKKITVFGWVRSIRAQKAFAFVALNDGSCFSNLQIIFDKDIGQFDFLIEQVTTGASIKVEGIIVESPGKNQALEIKAEKISILGTCNPEKYPLQKKRHSFEFLRTIAHLRPRTNTQGAIARVRSKLAFATHKFFQERGFIYLQSPIITGSDCEGSGEMFRVTTLDKKNKDLDFFNKPAYLTVSGQLAVENFACSLSNVYTFGPTFRAEVSHTSRHIAEFWMIEPELAFADLYDDMECAEAYIQFCIRYILENNKQDL